MDKLGRYKAGVHILRSYVDVYIEKEREGERHQDEKHAVLAEAARQALTLEDIAAWPVITYDTAFSGRSHIDQAFQARGLAPEIVLTAIDSDVIKTYVGLGLGVGIVASMAYEAVRDTGLVAFDVGSLIAPSMTRIAVKRDAYIRGYTFAFIERFAPALTRKVVERAKGILQRRQSITEEEAYLRMRNESRRLRKPMKELAEAIILAEELGRKDSSSPE